MSASPAPEDVEQQPKKISFRFCRECANLLYPKEDRVNNTLEFACRSCQYSEPADSACVFRNEMSTTAGETAGITQDVGQDPTVGLPDFCTLCGQEIFCEVCGQETDRGCWLEVDGNDDMAICTPTPPMTDPPSPDDNYFLPFSQHTQAQHRGPASEQQHQAPQTVGDTHLPDTMHDEQHMAAVSQQEGLPRISKTCPVCGQTEAVFFQSQQRTAETGMKLYYVCTDCGHVWQ